MADATKGISLAIPLQFNGPQPNHFGAPKATAEPMGSGDFIGDVAQGGSCNAEQVTLNPHCNGTHTETVGHIIEDKHQQFAPYQVIQSPLVKAYVLTVKPVNNYQGDETYTPPLHQSDSVICKDMLTSVSKLLQGVKALIIRTLPNDDSKKSRQYGADHQPPFFTHQAMRWLVEETDIDHLLVDMPSIDKMYDEGLLSNHRIFWQVDESGRWLNGNQSHKTITEMIYVPDVVADGFYTLNLQVAAWQLNAVPSNPVLLSESI
ncbi:arylformamidase [Marinicella pacifica]|uniref:Arylformamidase n=1 Tax=Marinicella pacifica TaxID=1171543 RepID=A0A917CL55_9GAMM|nr:cyclase family protein [Marinicella pacifica]GGF89131.1 arylformamidase [Marinicella pacifica]